MTTIHGLVEEQVRRTPRARAVLSTSGDLSYAELNAAANRIARTLRRLGVGPESRVAVLVERSPQFVVAVLATLKAAAAYVAIDPAYPEERIELLLEDCAAQVVLTQEATREPLEGVNATVLSLDGDAAVIAAERDDDLAPSACPANIAYVTYTSGSTGRPKGVAVPHAAVSALIRATRDTFRVGPGDRVLQFAALGFDVSVWEFVTALTSGAALYVPSEVRRRWRLRDVLEESGVTWMDLPPSVLAALPALELPSLRCLIAGGEVCPPAIARLWAEGRDFYNVYGPAEATICATWHHVREVPDSALRIPIGGPIAGYAAYVLDRRLQPSEEGELYIGGAGVARGYLGHPKATAASFIPDPFASTPGARMYRSGDLVRRVDDGGLEFVGRFDDQVKVSGFRIEPGEVEAVLEGCAEVREAVVLADSAYGRLVACLVTRDGELPDVQRIRRQLQAVLPAHMVPAHFVPFGELPLTPNGKADRIRLGELAGLARTPAGSAAADVRGDDEPHRIVCNAEEQHALWPAARDVPVGWAAVGGPAPRDECLAAVGDLWPEITPRSAAGPRAQRKRSASSCGV